ncbi:hypothetical protein FNV43_RR21227 [Rhamnella rubrinervis]|uniref:Uncharacterized protein n=1 Tax=Rhamnella rubrinervis TaxID=2594499 RepID=A0A8K0E2Y5_9ROSA|nr:hypothetical protein FNV43_RR21227 [Rhamnella rubrinervis]
MSNERPHLSSMIVAPERQEDDKPPPQGNMAGTSMAGSGVIAFDARVDQPELGKKAVMPSSIAIQARRVTPKTESVLGGQRGANRERNLMEI